MYLESIILYFQVDIPHHTDPLYPTRAKSPDSGCEPGGESAFGASSSGSANPARFETKSGNRYLVAVMQGSQVLGRNQMGGENREKMENDQPFRREPSVTRLYPSSATVYNSFRFTVE